MEAGELVHVISDCHIYDRHIPVVKELIQRTPYPAPTVKLNPEIKDFYDFTVDDLIIENYQTWPQTKTSRSLSEIKREKNIMNIIVAVA